MLAFDPKKRATMGQCLEDSSFDDYREDDLEARAGYRVDMEDVEEVKLESSHPIDAVSGHPGVPPQLGAHGG